MIEERLLTLKEVCDILGISKPIARRWGDSGKIRTIKINRRGHRRFYLSSVNEFLYGKNNNGHEKEEKVEINNVVDAIKYVLHNHRFKNSAEGMSEAADIIEIQYGYKKTEVISNIREMLTNGTLKHGN